ncbi:MAG: tryptophan-rich sensory protein [Oscillospiraceae bacterium]|nr:tryptophan-rich sensory protein [Oscillospiraceae bacterium]
MKKTTWQTYLFWIAVTEAVGALAGFLTREGTRLYNASAVKPALSPPSVVFPIVWSILFALMGVGAARIFGAEPSADRLWARRLFWLQLFFNFFWSIIFFNLQAYGFAFVWLAALWVLILLMILQWRKVDPLAAWLQIPYLLWVTFAGYLNFAVWKMN